MSSRGAERRSNPHSNIARYFTTLSATATLLFAALWLWIATVPLAYLDPEYPAWLAKQQMLQRCDLGDLLIVGDSRAAVDVIPALLPVQATNLAVGGGSPIEAYFAVKRALACATPPRRVIVSLSANHFVEPDLFWERTIRFGFLGPSDIAELTTSGDGGYAPLRGTSHWLAWLYAVRFPPLYFNSLLKSGGFLRWWHNNAALHAGMAARGQYFFGIDPGSDAVAAEGHLPEFTPLPLLDRCFDRMLTLLERHDIAVDFVAMPMNEATWQAVAPELRAGFLAYLQSQATHHANFHVIADAMSHWPDRWFGDGYAHLNPDGARRFSQQLAEYLSATARGATEHAERGAIGMVQ